MTGTDQTPAPDPAAQWLLAEFDATDPLVDLATYDADADEYRLPYYLQPMFQLKDGPDAGMDPGAEMRVTARDYYDYDRWWL